MGKISLPSFSSVWIEITQRLIKGYGSSDTISVVFEDVFEMDPYFEELWQCVVPPRD